MTQKYDTPVNKQFSINLNIKSMEELDDERGDIPRSKWIQGAIDDKLKGE